MRSAKPRIRARSQLEHDRVALLAALRSFHDTEHDAVMRVVEQVAMSILAHYWERDAAGAPLDRVMVERAITSRDELRGLRAKWEKQKSRLDERRALALQQRSLGDASARTSEHKSSGVLAGKRLVTFSDIEQRLARLNRAARELEARDRSSKRAFEEAARGARCEPDLNGDGIDGALRRAIEGRREMPIEGWDVATLIWQRFGGAIHEGGLRDADMHLDDRDDAIGHTVFIRAALSKFEEDDFLAPALHRLEREASNPRPLERGWLSRSSTHRFVLGVAWTHSSEEVCNPIWFPMSEARRLLAVDLEVRVAWLIRTGELALEAATGSCWPMGWHALRWETRATPEPSAWAQPSWHSTMTEGVGHALAGALDQPDHRSRMRALLSVRGTSEPMLNVLRVLAGAKGKMVSGEALDTALQVSGRSRRKLVKLLKETRHGALVASEGRRGYRLTPAGLSFLEQFEIELTSR